MSFCTSVLGSGKEATRTSGTLIRRGGLGDSRWKASRRSRHWPRVEVWSVVTETDWDSRPRANHRVLEVRVGLDNRRCFNWHPLFSDPLAVPSYLLLFDAYQLFCSFSLFRKDVFGWFTFTRTLTLASYFCHSVLYNHTLHLFPTLAVHACMTILASRLG